jgi:F420H(2)-dependent quinone reductase
MSNLSNNGDPAGRMRRQATLMRIVNAPMRKILGLPFRTPFAGRLMLVTPTGRRTGKIYHQPVSYVRDADTLLTPGGGKWKLNLQTGRPETIRLGGRDIQARPEIVQEAHEVDRLLRLMAAANPSITNFIPIPRDSDGHFDRDKLQAATSNGFRIIRWHLDN